MIVEQAIVNRIDGDGIWVETQRQSLCAACSANKACGTASMNRFLERKQDSGSSAVVQRHVVRVLNPDAVDVQPGQAVRIGLSEDALLRGSLMLYGLPVLMLILGAILGDRVLGGDIAALMLGLLGLLAGLKTVRWRLQQLENHREWHPVILSADAVEPLGQKPVTFHASI